MQPASVELSTSPCTENGHSLRQKTQIYLSEAVFRHCGVDAEVTPHLGLEHGLVDEGVVALGQDPFLHLLLVGSG